MTEIDQIKMLGEGQTVALAARCVCVCVCVCVCHSLRERR